jgi:hypothetical protein
MSTIEKSQRQERLDAQQAQASAEAWGQWAADINQRFARLESRFNCWFDSGDAGDFPDGGEPPMVVELVAEMTGVERKERAEAITRVADALREKIEAEISVLDERLSAKLDSKIFDLGSLKEFKAKIDKATTELKTEVGRGLEVASARLSVGSDRLDALERKRDVRNLIVQVASLHAQLKGLGGLEAQLKELRERLDLTRADVRALEQVVADAGIATLVDPPVLALPSPN